MWPVERVSFLVSFVAIWWMISVWRGAITPLRWNDRLMMAVMPIIPISTKRNLMFIVIQRNGWWRVLIVPIMSYIPLTVEASPMFDNGWCTHIMVPRNSDLVVMRRVSPTLCHSVCIRTVVRI